MRSIFQDQVFSVSNFFSGTPDEGPEHLQNSLPDPDPGSGPEKKRRFRGIFCDGHSFPLPDFAASPF